MAGSAFLHIDTSAAGAALAHTLTLTSDGQLREVRLYTSAAPVTAEDLTIIIHSALGAIYQYKILTYDMLDVTDLVRTYNPPILLYTGDAIMSAWTNSDGRNWGYQVIVEGR